MGTPIAGWFTMKNTIKWMMTGGIPMTMEQPPYDGNYIKLKHETGLSASFWSTTVFSHFSRSPRRLFLSQLLRESERSWVLRTTRG